MVLSRADEELWVGGGSGKMAEEVVEEDEEFFWDYSHTEEKNEDEGIQDEEVGSYTSQDHEEEEEEEEEEDQEKEEKPIRRPQHIVSRLAKDRLDSNPFFDFLSPSVKYSGFSFADMARRPPPPPSVTSLRSLYQIIMSFRRLLSSSFPLSLHFTLCASNPDTQASIEVTRTLPLRLCRFDMLSTVLRAQFDELFPGCAGSILSRVPRSHKLLFSSEEDEASSFLLYVPVQSGMTHSSVPPPLFTIHNSAAYSSLHGTLSIVREHSAESLHFGHPHSFTIANMNELVDGDGLQYRRMSRDSDVVPSALCFSTGMAEILVDPLVNVGGDMYLSVDLCFLRIPTDLLSRL